jgi:hypothetical protein
VGDGEEQQLGPNQSLVDSMPRSGDNTVTGMANDEMIPLLVSTFQKLTQTQVQRYSIHVGKTKKKGRIRRTGRTKTIHQQKSTRLIYTKSLRCSMVL